MKKLMICLIAVLAALSVNANSSRVNKKSGSSEPKTCIDVVKAKTTDVYDVYFRGGSEAEVAVIGDGDTDLDLYVYDENGNLIEKGIRLGDECYVSWTPKWSGHFKIKVKNLGNESNCYLLLTN